MEKDGLHFPDKIKGLTKADSFKALKVSTGVPRYFKDDEGFWGFHLGNCGLTQEDWNYIHNNNIYKISKLAVVHLGNHPNSTNPNTIEAIWLSSYKTLRFIDVSHNLALFSLKTTPESPIEKLQIEKIIASDCPKLTGIVLEGNFPQLSQIEAARCALAEFTLGNCPQLRFLELSHNQLATLAIPATCQNLTYLFAKNNQLKTIELPDKLPVLNVLDISQNQLTQLPRQLQAAAALEEVNLFNNQINDIEQFKAFIERDFPLNWKRGKGGFILEGNPLDEAVVSMLNEENEVEKKARLLEAIRLLEKGRNPEVRRAKLILLGNTGVGKTTLSDVLTGQDKVQQGSTHGINLFRYTISGQDVPIEVQGFDFGGQDYYHSTHFAFFGYNTFYLLLWGNHQPHDALSLNDEQDKRFPLNYWLGSVNFYDKRIGTQNETTSKDVVLHLLQNLATNAPERRELDNWTLKQRYGFVKSFEAFDVKVEKEKVLVRKESSLQAWLNAQLDAYAKPIVISKIEADIATALRQSKKVVLTLKELQELNNDTKNNTPEQTLLLAQSLNDRFECYYIGERTIQGDAYLTEQLPQKVIVDLEQFTGWVYKILSAEIKHDGYFTKEQALERLTEREAKAEIDFILAFMLHHKIIFRVQNATGEYIAPHYLNATPKVAEQLFLDSFEAPLVKYQFQEFFHVNLIVEVMLQFYEVLLQETEVGEWRYVMWKNKIILYEEANHGPKKLLLVDFEEEIKEDTTKIASIRLHRFIKNAVSDDFLKKVMTFIEDKVQSYQYEKLIITPFGNHIPAKCLEQQNTDSEGKNKGLVYHADHIYRKAEFKLFLPNPDAYPLKRLFISYSSKQSDFMRRFEVHLAPLKQNGIIDVWHDRMIESGSSWDAAIKAQLEASDIVVFLLSPDFLNTPYVVQEEIPKALEMEKNGKTKIFPIELIPCGWSHLPMLSALQIVSDSKGTDKQILTVGEATNSIAWEKIIQKLIEFIK